jgi:type IV secretion system protein VirB8
VQPARSWVSVIRYRFTGEPMSMEERLVNPLGFQVVRYRRDQEALAPAVQPNQTGSPVMQQAPPPGQAPVRVVPPAPQPAPAQRPPQRIEPEQEL